MTQKELSYVEDAIAHEQNIINICEDVIKRLKDDSLISFMDNEIDEHVNTKNRLMEILGDKAHG